MIPYTILPHTADVRLKVQGKTLKDLFQNALLGMNEIIKTGYCKQRKIYSIKKSVLLKSSDTTSLLIDFLSEVLTLTQINRTLYCKILINKINKNYLQAQISGDKVSSFDQDIKAVTYTEAEIIKNKKGEYQTIIVFDI